MCPTLRVLTNPILFLSKRCLLNFCDSLPRYRKDTHDVLIFSEIPKKVPNMTASGLPAAERRFPSLHAVHATLVGEDEQAVFAETRRNELRRVLAFRGDALQPAAAAVLRAEGFHWRVPNVIVLAERNDDGSLFDEVFAVHGQGHGVDEGATLVTVPVDQFSHLPLQNRQSARP